MAMYDEWFDWTSSGMGPAANWDTIFTYYFNYLTQSDYWFITHRCDVWRNTMTAIWILKDKILENGNGEVTMDSILSAMVTADFDQLKYFIGLVDAYRVSLWNEPFNAEYYAALARGFMP